MHNEASVGGIFGELFGTLEGSWRDFALYTFVVGGLTAAGVVAGLTETAAGSVNYGFSVDSTDTPASALFEFVSAVVSLFGTYLLLARLIAARGRLRATGGRFWAYVAMSVLSIVAVVIGLLLVIVPGIVLLVRWSAASGYVIGGGETITGSLGASWEATNGHGWSIFLAAIVLFLGILLGAGVIGALFGLAGEQAAGVASAFVEAASGGIFAAFGLAIYFRVSDDAQEISEVFA